MRKRILLIIFALSFFFPSHSMAADIDTEKSRLNNLETSLTTTANKITDLENQISNINLTLIEKEASVNAAITEEKNEYEEIKTTIKHLYETDKSTYLDILLESKSYIDFVNNVYYTSELMKYDQKKIQKYQELVNNIEEEKQEIEKKKTELEKKKEKVEKKKHDLETSIQEKKDMIEKMSEETKTVITTAATSSIPTTTYTTANDYGYSDQQLDLICAIVAQECSSDYDGSLAVITCAMNRCASARWAYLGTDPLSQLCAPYQFTYSIDGLYERRLNGNYADFVKQAVLDALGGKRNHNYLSFRSYANPGSVNIGGNWYFNAM